MGFEVKTVLDLEAITAYQKITGKSIQKRKTILARSALVVVGVVGLTMCGYAIGTAGVNGTGILGMVLSALCLSMGTAWYSYHTRRLARRIPANFEQHFYFGEENMAATANGQELAHAYSAFKTVAESEDYFVLFQNPKMGYVLPKSGFVKGQPADFSKFIAEKTGKPVIPVTL